MKKLHICQKELIKLKVMTKIIGFTNVNPVSKKDKYLIRNDIKKIINNIAKVLLFFI